VRAWLRVAGWLQAVGYYPSMADMGHVALSKRKASKPHWWMTYPVPEGVVIEDVAGASGGPPVPVRTYRPRDAHGPLPVVAFAHGGGFVNCGVDLVQYPCAQLSKSAQTLVVSIDYPLAPEEPFPAALESVYGALTWLAGDADGPLIVMGDSAGGNLVAAACLLARRRGGPEIAHQVLIYPTLDATLSTPSLMGETAERRAECEAFFRHYAGEASADDELVSPLLASDLSGLPAATIITAEHDSFRDDGRLYAERLREAGVPVQFTEYAGMPHGFLSMPRLCRAAPQALAQVADVVTRFRTCRSAAPARSRTRARR
jgi:acetyl esterase